MTKHLDDVSIVDLPGILEQHVAWSDDLSTEMVMQVVPARLFDTVASTALLGDVVLWGFVTWCLHTHTHTHTHTHAHNTHDALD